MLIHGFMLFQRIVATADKETIMKLLIRNLARSTTETELQALFAAHGIVQFCNLVLDKESGGSKGFAFVEMPKAGEAKAAMKYLNGRAIDGKTIRVKKAATHVD